MAFYVRDETTDRLVRAFATRNGLGITEAIRTAVTEADRARLDDFQAARASLESLWDEVRARKTMRFQATMAETDKMWDD